MPRMPQFNDPFMNEDEDEYLPSAPPLPMRAPIADAADISSLIAGASSVQDPTRPRPQSPPLRPAMNELARVNAQRPQYGDPVLKPKALDRVLGGIVGGALGAGTAYVNSGSRGRVMQDQSGEIGANFTNRRYNNAQRDWQDQATKAQTAAEIESKQIATQRDDSFNQARIANQQAQQEAARARAKKLSQPEVPKPIDRNPEHDLVVPDGQGGFKVVMKGTPKPVKPSTPNTIQERINQIRGDQNLTPEQQEAAVSLAVSDYNKLNPAKPITISKEDDNGNVRVFAVDPADVAKAGAGGMNLGRVGKTKTPPASSSSADGDAALVDTVINNPALWDSLTPTVRTRLAPKLAQAGYTDFGKSLSGAEVKGLSGSKSAIASLNDLREVLVKNEQYIGPIAGLQALNPWSDAKKAQADIDRTKQRVGKVLEGGVLRKEDEAKYKKILATLTDDPTTAVYKVDQMIQDMQRDMEIYAEELRSAGRRVPPTGGGAASGAGKGSGQDPQSLVGKTVKFKDGVSRRILKVLPNGELETDPPR
jgi:hypothetical protein